MRRSLALLRGLAAAAVPANYSNTPYKKNPAEKSNTKRHNNSNRNSFRNEPQLVDPFGLKMQQQQQQQRLQRPHLLSGNDIKQQVIRNSNISLISKSSSFRSELCNKADISLRQELFTLHNNSNSNASNSKAAAASLSQPLARRRNLLGDALANDLSCRWSAKFYGNVTYGPRNYPYSSSRWLARRFQMKKHKIIKRFRFRRYKLAAVANLPFAKMIRVGMLPELKSSKTKKADTVDAGLSAQLVKAAREGSGAGTGGKSKTRGRRSRPKSKYQV